VAANASRFQNRLNVAYEINLTRFLRAADSPEHAHGNGSANNYLSQFHFLQNQMQESFQKINSISNFDAEHKSARRHCQANDSNAKMS
jgi:hypothetical protein